MEPPSIPSLTRRRCSPFVYVRLSFCYLHYAARLIYLVLSNTALKHRHLYRSSYPVSPLFPSFFAFGFSCFSTCSYSSLPSSICCLPSLSSFSLRPAVTPPLSSFSFDYYFRTIQMIFLHSFCALFFLVSFLLCLRQLFHVQQLL